MFSWVISMPKQVLVQQGETPNEGPNTDDVRPQFGPKQLIHDPTHILRNSLHCFDFYFSADSCIGFRIPFLFTSELSPSYRICKIQSQNLLPPPVEHEIWHYGKSKTDLILKTMNPRGIKNLEINEIVCVFIKAIINIVSNFLPHETVSCNDHHAP